MPTSAADPTSRTATPPARPRRRWYQFTLRTVGVWMVLLCLLLGSFAWWRDRAERQRKVVEELRGLGATVAYRIFSLTKRPGIHDGLMYKVDSHDEFFLCSWLRHALGDNFVYNVDRIKLTDSPAFYQTPSATRELTLRLLQKCPHIKELTIEGNVVRVTDLKETPFLQSLEILHIDTVSRDSRGGLTEDDLEVLGQAASLQELCIERQLFPDAGLAHLQDCRRLQILLFTDTNMGDEGLRHVSELTELVQLHVSRALITDAGLRHLHKLSQLQYLSLAGNTISGEGLADVGPQIFLRFLSVDQTNFTDEALRHLKQFPRLASLDITNTKVSGSGIPYLAGLPELGEISLYGCPVTDASLVGIEIPHGWRMIQLDGTSITDNGFCALKIPKSVNQIYLTGTKVTDASLDHLQTLPNLSHVGVSDTKVTPAGVKRFQASHPNCQVYD